MCRAKKWQADYAMNKTVAIDDKLTNVRQALVAEGYQVIGLNDDLAQAGAVVVSGMDKNMTGDQGTSLRLPRPL